MAAPNLRTTALMTEHLEYPPVSLLDDIINSVNDIMYKCTAAMEKYLLKKSVVNGVDYSEEIRVGVAQLESLLEHSVDKNFDRLELYTLRNILRIPDELVENNVFRLKHQRDLTIVDEYVRDKSEQEINNKIIEIELEFLKNRMLVEKLNKLKKLKIDIKIFREMVNRICNIQINNNNNNNNNTDKMVEFNAIYKSLQPIDDSMKLLTTQLRQLYESNEEICSIDELNEILLRNYKKNNTIEDRADYINSTTSKIINQANNNIQRQNYSKRNIEIIIEDPDII